MSEYSVNGNHLFKKVGNEFKLWDAKKRDFVEIPKNITFGTIMDARPVDESEAKKLMNRR